LGDDKTADDNFLILGDDKTTFWCKKFKFDQNGLTWFMIWTAV